MQNESEQIGPLIFVPNSDYPYPFTVEKPPHFWMEEQTGTLAEAVNTYMNGEQLKGAQLELIKIYLRQYIERAIMGEGADRRRLLSAIERLRTTHDVEQFADEVSEFGVEAF